MPTKLGALLVEENLVSEQQLGDALAYQKTHGGLLGHCLVHLGFLEDEDIVTVLARKYRVSRVDLSTAEIDPSVLRLVSEETAIKYRIVPLWLEGKKLVIAMADPTNVSAIDELVFMTGCMLEPAVSTEAAIVEAIEKHYGRLQTLETQHETAGEELDSVEPAQTSLEGPIEKLGNFIFTEALSRGASEFLIEPYEREFQIRFRIDGVLYVVMNPPMRLREAMTSHFKSMAGLNLSEKRLPQEGRGTIRIEDGQVVSFRLSSLLTLFGERIAVQLAERPRPRELSELGLEAEPLQRLERSLSKLHGLVLITGPPGSGKTTTLYSILSHLNTPEVMIVTVENSVELVLAGLHQVEENSTLGSNSELTLKSLLACKPDIAMIGELRDRETAWLAVKAAMGRLVLAGLESLDALSAIHSLMSLPGANGSDKEASRPTLDTFTTAKALRMVVNQRLVRRICEKCKTRVESPQGLDELGFPESKSANLELFRGRGCPDCDDTGYRGMVGVFEVLSIDEEIRELIQKGAGEPELRHKVVQKGMVRLREAGLRKIQAGMATPQEVFRETDA